MSIVLAGLALSGCGGSSTSATAPLPPGVTTYAPLPPLHSVSYEVTLSPNVLTPPAPPGAPGASAHLVLSVNAPKMELCWTFSELKNIEHPTVARVYRHPGYGPLGIGFKLGEKFTLMGCRPENEGFLKLLGAKPEQFFVAIHTPKYPLGAVRGDI